MPQKLPLPHMLFKMTTPTLNCIKYLNSTKNKP